MTWNEADHPRDELGRFTFSGGGDEEENENEDTPVLKGRVEKTDNPAGILYGNSQKKTQNEKSYRNTLLSVLKDVATPAMVLYSSTKQLEEAVKKNGLTSKLKNAVKMTSDLKEKGKSIIQKRIEKAIGEDYNESAHRTAKFFARQDGAGMLDLAHGAKMNDRNYIKDTISLDNYNDPKVAKDKEYLKEKISKQFSDYNFDINKIKGYYFKSNSEPTQRLVQNKDFQDMIRNHKKEILEKGQFSDGFKKHGFVGVLWNNNFHNAIGKADFRNIYQDKNGNLHVKMYDTYDFNKNEDNPLIKAGVSQMEKGNLKPFFTIHDIIIPKNILDEIWK